MTGLLIRKDLETREITIERAFHAPVERVWRSWTMAAELESWWGPTGWQTTVRSLDVRPGGLWHFGMGPQGAAPEVWIRAVYSEVIAPSMLRYVEGFSDETGADLDPESNAVAVEFIELEPGTTRVVLSTRFASAERLERIVAMGFDKGWDGAFGRLASRLEERA